MSLPEPYPLREYGSPVFSIEHTIMDFLLTSLLKDVGLSERYVDSRRKWNSTRKSRTVALSCSFAVFLTRLQICRTEEINLN